MKQTHEGGRITRRATLRTAAAFMILPTGLRLGYAANQKLNIGMIGLAGIGGVDVKTFNSLGENITAICDVDTTVLDKRGSEYPGARKYTDFRQMIEKEKLDGVSIAVPDHMHCYISVWAMKHGLNVYCQKPLTQTMHEARVIARVAAETKVVTQMGTQFSAMPSAMRTVELIQSGALGEITEIHLATDRPIWPQGLDRPPGEDPVPPTLNWDLWLGTAPARPYQAVWPAGHPVYSPERKKQFAAKGTMFHPFVWRGWTEYGTGVMGDQAPHSMNVIFWALDLGAPSAAEILDTDGMKKEMYPNYSVTRFEWAARGVHPPLKIFHYDGGKTVPKEITGPITGRGMGGLTWIGTKGSLPAGRGPYLGQTAEPYATPPQRDWGREEVHKDWCTAIKAGKQAPCHFGYAGPFTEAYLLGNVALRVGHRVEWDPLAFRITNCREANQYLRRAEYRRGWDLKEIAGAAAYNV